jgi:DNA polymerase V
MKNKTRTEPPAKAAGFPSPAQGYEENSLDLNALLIANPPATFFMRSVSSSMAAYGIFNGTLLIVDRSIRPKRGSIVVIVYEGDFLCRELRIKGGHSYFTDGLTEIGGNIEIFGTVKAAINDFPH